MQKSQVYPSTSQKVGSCIWHWRCHEPYYEKHHILLTLMSKIIYINKNQNPTQPKHWGVIVTVLKSQKKEKHGNELSCESSTGDKRTPRKKACLVASTDQSSPVLGRADRCTSNGLLASAPQDEASISPAQVESQPLTPTPGYLTPHSREAAQQVLHLLTLHRRHLRAVQP